MVFDFFKKVFWKNLRKCITAYVLDNSNSNPSTVKLHIVECAAITKIYLVRQIYYINVLPYVMGWYYLHLYGKFLFMLINSFLPNNNLNSIQVFLRLLKDFKSILCMLG